VSEETSDGVLELVSGNALEPVSDVAFEELSDAALEEVSEDVPEPGSSSANAAKFIGKNVSAKQRERTIESIRFLCFIVSPAL